VLGVGIRFDLGRYHATPWDAHVNDGLVELPPSPWRLLRSMYAVARTNVGLHDRLEQLDLALTKLAQAPPPTFYLPPFTLAHTRHYMPSRLYSRTASGEADRMLDAFAAVDPAVEMEVWWQSSLDDVELKALRSAVMALGYLGRSESVCSARILDSEAPRAANAFPVAQLNDLTNSHTLVSLLCPTGDGAFDSLATSVGELRQRRMSQPPQTRLVDYALEDGSPLSAGTPQPARPTLACFRLSGGSRPGLSEAVTVNTLMRSALQRKFDKHRTGERSPVFSGHADSGHRQDQHQHAHYLALPGADGRRIDHLVVWAPEGFGEAEVASLATLRELRMRNLPSPLRVALTTLGDDRRVQLESLLGPSDRWQSLTPFALPRHPKRRNGITVDGPEDQIRRELNFRDPHKAELLTAVSWIRSDKWTRFRRTRSGVSRLQAAQVVGAELHFAEPVRGPIAIGALSHFGLGVFVRASG
jgi:CRISPR-associated protein Csb2